MKFDAKNAPSEGRPDFPKLELKKDEIGRICILSSKGWEVTVRHFVAGLGYVHCLAIKEAKTPVDLLKIETEGGAPDHCYLCKLASTGGSTLVGLPQRRFALPVLRYKTTLLGLPSPGALKYWLEIWIIGKRKYRQLRGILEEWGNFETHDLTLTCTDAKYQNMDIDVKKDALWLKEKQAVFDYVKEEFPKYRLFDCLGDSLDEVALKRRLSIIERRTAKEAPVDLSSDELLSPAAEAESSEGFFDFGEEKAVVGKEVLSDEVPPVTGKEEAGEVDFLEEMLRDEG